MKTFSRSTQRFFFVFLLITITCTIHAQKQLSSAEFKNPPSNVRIHTWWHWLDGNITKDGITKDLEAMKEQGIVQATILNIGLFGEKDFGVKKANFNTAEWFEMFQWALKEAHRLGISIGVHNCDGWSTSGGPWITPEMSMKQYIWTKTIVDASKSGAVTLKQPQANWNFYKDVAVVAVKSADPLNSFQRAAPIALLNDNTNADYIFDGCTSSGMNITKGDKITFRFKKPFSAEKIVIMPRRTFMWSNPGDFISTYSFSSSEDGKNFKKLKEFTVNGLNKMVSVSFEKTSSKYYQLSLIETNNLDNWIPLTLAECELLPEKEKPLYANEIDYLSEKAGNVKAAMESGFYATTKASGPNGLKEVVDITSKMSSDGTLNWKPEKGEWTIIRFGYTTTGMTNGPATQSGRGLECDKMDTVALNLHFNSFPAKLIEKAGSYAGNTFKFMLIDSWEAGYQNWTANMLKEFEQRRGYSLLSYIPLLCGESSGNTEVDEAVLFDLRKTTADLIENNYYKHFGELLHRNKIEFHAEIIYGNENYPSLDILKTTQYVDLPMYEFWSSTNNNNIVTYSPSRGVELNMPCVAAIGYEKPVLGSEAFTGMAHYSETPSSLKPFGDKAFCAGINQLILHSYVHQPNDKKPGMTLGQWGSHFNRNNSYWPYISEWFNYQARIQDILQQGVAFHDVLYYLGDQLPQYLTYNNSNELPFGYMFNACNYDILKNRIKVTDGKLLLNGKVSYSVLSLSSFKCLSFETLQRLEELVNQGIILYAPKPSQMLSLSDIKNNKQAFTELVAKLWGNIDGSSVTSNSYGKGKVYWGIPLANVLKTERILPDVSTQQDDATNLMFIHKKTDGSDVYFVMNQQNQELRREISFRITGKTPEIWDPENGATIKPAVYTMDENVTTLPVTLKPYQSLLFVFKNEKPGNYIKLVKEHENQLFPAPNPSKPEALPSVVLENNSFVATSQTGGEFEFITNQQKSYTLKTVKYQEFALSDYSGRITFEPGYSATIQSVDFTKLQWLSESENPDIKYFSGTAKYVISFAFPDEKLQQADSVLFDLGEFESIAEVKLNGTNLGRIWKPGTYIPVKGILKAENLLEVAIATVYRNRFIGDLTQFGEVRNLWSSSPITNFLNKDLPLKPSGLKGPMKVIAIKKQKLTD
jgi:hypothetical protein